jgi:asparagine synthase (glutamine-hydrolysing)
MCGICGSYSYGTSEPVDERLLQAMMGRLVHRGPDDEGQHIDGRIGLGIRRLSIIDVAGGHQPIHNEDQTVWVVFNGEIYNFAELRRELEAKGHRFYTRSDTEVIAHGYEEWGDDCLLRFNGIFGLAIWDRRSQRLLLARDHYGVKPLYFHDTGRRLLWSSEVKSLLAESAIPREVDTDALDLYLTFGFVPSPQTMLKGIRKLAPGHRAIADRNGVRVERYWQPCPTVDSSLTEREYIAVLQDRLEAAVRRQMVSDVPIGALLSGGVDSAVVVAIMTQYTDHPVRTFSVGFRDGGPLNELPDARATAKLLKTEHHEVELGSEDFIRWQEKVICHLEEPVSSTAPVSLFLLSRLASEHVKVVLTGQGADEPFSGYPRYLGERYGRVYRRVPAAIRKRLLGPLVEALPRQERLKRAVRSLGVQDVTERFVSAYAFFPHESRERLWRAGQRPTGSARGAHEVVSYWREGLESLDSLPQMAYVDARLSLPDDFLIYGDKMSMASGLEARVPFLDLELMAVAETLPASLRIRWLRRKYVYKKVVAKWLPAEIIGRSKRAFDAPTELWFRRELSDYLRDLLLSSSSACRSFFDRDVLESVLRDHSSGRRDNRRRVFNLLVFETWHRQFISSTRFAC